MRNNSKKTLVGSNSQTDVQAVAKRDYKDTLFRMIFNDEEHLLSLYNAVNGTSYKETSDLEIVTLENAVYMNMKNDLAFLMDFHLNLYEHQSTFNPNMPLRNLFYVAKEYQKLVDKQTLYASAQVKIPAARFIVFYNGVEEQPERRILKLSDAYEKAIAVPELELKVTMLNINSSNNEELLSQCRLLKEYMFYVECVRRYVAVMPLEEAVEQAVAECIEKDILKAFLTKYRAEAVYVSIFEYNEEKEKELIRKAEYEVGLKEGREEGFIQGIKALIKTCKDFHTTKDDTISRVASSFSLTQEKATVYVEQYW